MLRRFIDSPDPVVFLEPKRLYWAKEQTELPADTGPLGWATVRRPGTDATPIAYRPTVPATLEAAAVAADDGWNLEVIDLRTLTPFDDATVCASVRRTGRAVVVHEAHGLAGPGAEIAARITKRCFSHLEATVRRVTGFDVPYRAPLLERHYLPGVDRVLDAVARLEWGETITL